MSFFELAAALAPLGVVIDAIIVYLIFRKARKNSAPKWVAKLLGKHPFKDIDRRDYALGF